MGQSFELSSFVNQLLYQGTIAFVVVSILQGIQYLLMVYEFFCYFRICFIHVC